MSNFIIPNIPDIDQKIENDLSHIKQKILTTYGKKNIFAILLCGGFGRGEGGIIKVKGTFKPLNDYDLLLITKNRINPPSLQSLGEKLAKEVKIRFVDLGAIKKSRLKKIPRTIFTYDLRHGSRIIFGNKNILDEVPIFSSQKIPREEGRKILFNRPICFLELTPDFFALNRKLTEEEKLKMVLQISKSIIAGVIALLVLKRKYESSFQKQLENFLRYYPYSKWKNFVSLSYKLKLGVADPKKINPWEYWFSARSFYLESMKMFLNKYYNSDFKNWKEFLNFYAQNPPKISSIQQLKEIFKFLIWREPLSKPELKIIVEIVTILTILSLRKELTLESDYFELAKRYLRRIFKKTRKKSTQIENWNDLKQICTQLWFTYHH